MYKMEIELLLYYNVKYSAIFKKGKNTSRFQYLLWKYQCILVFEEVNFPVANTYSNFHVASK